MAGSFNHILKEDGTFDMSLIENLGDAHEALEECFALIYYLSKEGKIKKLDKAFKQSGHCSPWNPDHLHGENPPKKMKLKES